MPASPAFRLPRLCLPRAGIDLSKWAVVACDQYTSEPEYWQAVAREVGDAPSTLHLTFPEVYLGSADDQRRITAIQATMRRYLEQGLLQDHAGAVYVERHVGGRTRHGLMLELDLEHYDFSAASTSLIRPTEGTIVERLAPRIAVRSGAELELPHILVLIDDPDRTVIEPIAAARDGLPRLYQTGLMFGGGQVSGHAVDAALAARAVQALQALAEPQAFAARLGVPAGTPVMQFAMGDGNHSLATAKSIWERVKGQVGMDHPSRYALVEIENIHDPALVFEPIHRLLQGVTVDIRQALARSFGSHLSCTDVATGAALRERLQAVPPGRHAAGLIGPGPRYSLVEVSAPAAALAVATFQAFIDAMLEQGGAAGIDYVHGDEVLERLATGAGQVGFHLATVGKSELLRRVALDGPLPRKTFSMGEAHEKRFYVEARRIGAPGAAAPAR
jgi:hypothetical protein